MVTLLYNRERERERERSFFSLGSKTDFFAYTKDDGKLKDEKLPYLLLHSIYFNSTQLSHEQKENIHSGEVSSEKRAIKTSVYTR